MRARLQPVGAVTGKFRRIARDLAASMGKQIRVELEGEDVGVEGPSTRRSATRCCTSCATPWTTASSRPPSGARPESRPRAAFASGPSTRAGACTSRCPTTVAASTAERLVARAVAAGVLSRERPRPSARAAPGADVPPGPVDQGRDHHASRAAASAWTWCAPASTGRGQHRGLVRVGLRDGVPHQRPADAGDHAGGARLVGRRALRASPGPHPGGRAARARRVLGAVDEVDGARLYRLRGRLLPLLVLASTSGCGRGDAGAA